MNPYHCIDSYNFHEDIHIDREGRVYNRPSTYTVVLKNRLKKTLFTCINALIC